MSSDIVKTLKVMCNQEDPQDQKLLLLAELVETKCEALAQKQDSLQKSLDKTTEKLDKAIEVFEKFEKAEESCPIHKNKEDFEKLSFVLRYPRLSFLMLLGIIVLIAGFFGTSLIDALKLILGL